MIDNFVQYSMNHYKNPHTTVEDFKEDCNRFTDLNKLFGRYYKNNDLKVRLILNHVVILYNVFEAEACTNMLFFKMKKEYWPGLKTILTFLNFMPAEFDYKYDSDIKIDLGIAEELRKL